MEEPDEQRRRRYEVACSLATGQPIQQGPHLAIQQAPNAEQQAALPQLPQLFTQTLPSPLSMQQPSPQLGEAFSQLSASFQQRSLSFRRHALSSRRRALHLRYHSKQSKRSLQSSRITQRLAPPRPLIQPGSAQVHQRNSRQLHRTPRLLSLHKLLSPRPRRSGSTPNRADRKKNVSLQL